MKVALIGRGFGANIMAPAYEGLGFQVEVVSSRDSDAVARACDVADLVSIHSPPFQHREHVMAALEAGKDVLCDKPFGRNAAEAREMRDAAKAAGVLHFLNFEFRCQPAWEKARDLIAEGTIGDLVHVNWSSFGNGLRGRKHGWLNDADLAGGWIGAYGSHVIDGLRLFFGKEVADCGGVTRAETRFRPDADGNQVRSTAEDAFSAWFVMEGGGTVSVDTAYSASVNLPASTQLLGSEGALTIAGDVVTLHKPKAEPQVFDLTPAPGGPPMPGVPIWLEKVQAALRDRRQIAPNFDDGVAAAEVMDRLKAAVVRAD